MAALSHIFVEKFHAFKVAAADKPTCLCQIRKMVLGQVLHLDNASGPTTGPNGHLRQKGKIAELALGYGGSVGALKAMGALEMGLSEDELQPLVTAWRNSNQNIVRFWWDIDRAAMNALNICDAEAQ